jgi:hypothetical protein
MVTELDTPEPNPPGGVLCDACGISEAVLAAHYPSIRARPPHWCGPCGGQALTDLVTDGQTITITSTATSDTASAAPVVDPRATATPTGQNDSEVGITDLPWTVEYAVELLRYARPGGLAFARALVDEGGTATAARLREVIGVTALNQAPGRAPPPRVAPRRGTPSPAPADRPPAPRQPALPAAPVETRAPR